MSSTSKMIKLTFRLPFPSTVRGYATRRPERPPSKIKDPLVAPNATQYKVTPTLTFIHRPPPTAPTPYSLTTAPASPLLLVKPLTSKPQASSSTPMSPIAKLPPLLRKPRKQPENLLTDEQKEEVKRLRASDPVKWTRHNLAKHFGCSAAYIPMIAPLKTAEMRGALARRDAEHDAKRNRWGERKATIVAIRQKRRSLW